MVLYSNFCKRGIDNTGLEYYNISENKIYGGKDLCVKERKFC